VEKILRKKVVYGNNSNTNHVFYLVHWKGYSENDATWEPLENLKNALVEVQNFEQKLWKGDNHSV
jgi:hypothetical protein